MARQRNKHTILFLCVFLLSVATVQAAEFDKQGHLWQYVEWDIDNPSYTGNPFDLIATVTFTHTQSSATHTTQMFYDGQSTWRWRFTGTKTGTWTFTSSSNDQDLDGLTGTVTVSKNPNEDTYGFMTEYATSDHTKWARHKGNDGEIEVFVPQYVMYYDDVSAFHNKQGLIDEDIQIMMVEHGFSGFHVPRIAADWFDIDTDSKKRITSDHINPDIRAFEALDELIIKTHAAGGVVHIWAWGDKSRTQTSVNLVGGANGEVDKRLQRYIAARLGPLPGWSMGYGFDLFEWTEEEMLEEWHAYMHEHLGWHHYLGGRASKNRLNQLYEGFDYSSYEWHRPTYGDYRDHITARPHKPTFSEDRFRTRNSVQHAEKDYDLDMVRQGLWHSVMAGGIANIWGYLIDDTTGKNVGHSMPYPNAQELRTYATFWEGRFLADMVVANSLTDGHALKANNNYIFYKESTTKIDMDLSTMPDPTAAIAIDTKKPYAELDIGVLSNTDQTWTAPYSSDWAIAVGQFDTAQAPAPNTPPTISLTSPASDDSFAVDDQVTLSATASDSDGSIARVEFFVDGTRVKSDSSNPYSYLWSATAGSHTAHAVATDNLGATTSSSSVSFSVEEPQQEIPDDATNKMTRNPDRVSRQGTLRVQTTDTIIYDTGYYSLDGQQWVAFQLQGQQAINSWLWDFGSADVVIPSSAPISQANFVVTYSCTLSQASWDCHNNAWQLERFAVQ